MVRPYLSRRANGQQVFHQLPNKSKGEKYYSLEALNQAITFAIIQNKHWGIRKQIIEKVSNNSRLQGRLNPCKLLYPWKWLLRNKFMASLSLFPSALIQEIDQEWTLWFDSQKLPVGWASIPFESKVLKRRHLRWRWVSAPRIELLGENN